MRPLTRSETEAIARALQPMVGAQLQECAQDANELGLAFYRGGAGGRQGQVEWLWFDFDPQRPFVARFNGKAPRKKKPPKPLGLFVRAHLVGRRLVAVESDKAFGRVLTFAFFGGPPNAKGDQPTYEFEARLFPHGQNAIARAAGKSVALKIPQDLQEAPPTTAAEPAPRAWAEMQAEWEARVGLAAPAASSSSRAPDGGPEAIAAAPETPERRAWRRALEKKTRAIEKMRADLAAKEGAAWARVGEWLKARGAVGEPRDWPEAAAWAACLDASRSLSWNIQNCFAKAKDSARKIAGARERLAQVERELAKLAAREPVAGRASGSAFGRASGRALGADATDPAAKPAPSLLARAEARGRHLRAADDLDAYVGKSARDNIALLRKAQPHDYWLHLRDYPSAHAILRRPKGRAVKDSEFMKAGLWLVEQSLKKSAHELAGQSFDLIVAECRHVKPIKGDKLGRVHYANERTLRARFR